MLTEITKAQLVNWRLAQLMDQKKSKLRPNFYGQKKQRGSCT